MNKSLLGNGFKVVSNNIRSILKHKDELSVTLSSVDVLCLQETWLTDLTNDNLIQMNGFSHFRQDRNIMVNHNGSLRAKAGGGLLIYVKEDLAPYVEVIEHCSVCSENIEQLWVKICKPKRRMCIVGSIYRPPSSSINESMSELDSTLQHIALLVNVSRVDFIMLGDFNINYAKPLNTDTRKLKVVTNKLHLRQIIRSSTRITCKTKSTIDLIFTNIDHIRDSGVLDYIISDHRPVYMIKKHARFKPSFVTTLQRNYRTYNKVNWENQIERDWRWIDFWNIKDDPNKLWECMLGIFIANANKLYPLKKSRNWKDKADWVDEEVIRAIDQKSRLYRRATHTNLQIDWARFRLMRNKVQKLLLHKKRTYITKTLQSTKNDPRGFWMEMGKNLQIGKHRTSPGLKVVKGGNGQMATGLEAANIMNNYYIDMGPNLAKKFDDKWAPSTFFDRLNVVPFSFKFISTEIVHKVIKSLPINKSSGVRSLSTRLLRDGFLCMIVEFTHLINECLRLSVMPTKWKKGTITPMPKGKVTANPNDWRPVSVLPFPSKIIERIVNHQIVYHFECNSYICPNQHGFRKGFSTSTAVFDYVQFLYDNYDAIKGSSSIFIDYSRAFDTIDHEILCEKLKLYGLDEVSLKWFKNYLSDRTQVVRVDNNLSHTSHIKMGVPQGSIVGPFLFIVYINDLVSECISENVSMLLYADDTILYTACDTVEDATRTNQIALDKLCNWCSINRLSLNIKKTKHMVVRHNREKSIDGIDICDVFIKGEKLENVSSYKYLGVTVDDHLSFTDFINQKYNKANVRLYQLKRLRPFITNDIACRIYKQTILPLVDYADFMIESTCPSTYEKLLKLQEKAISYIDNNTNKTLSYDELLKIYNVQPLKLRWREHILCLMYRQSKKKKRLEIKRPRINLRSNNKVKFKKPLMRTYELYLKSPLCRCIKIWETLSSEIQKATTKVKFKNLIRPICRPT